MCSTLLSLSAFLFEHFARGYDTGLVETDSGGLRLQLVPGFGMKSVIYSGLGFHVESGTVLRILQLFHCRLHLIGSLQKMPECAERVEVASIRNLGCDTSTVTGSSDDTLYNITYKLPGGVAIIISFDVYHKQEPPQMVYGPAMLSKTDFSNAMTRELFNASQSIILSSWYDSMLATVDRNDGYDVDGTLILPHGEVNEIDNTRKDETLPASHALSAHLHYILAGEILALTTEVTFDTYGNDVLEVLNVTDSMGAVFDNVATSTTSYISSHNPTRPSSSALNLMVDGSVRDGARCRPFQHRRHGHRYPIFLHYNLRSVLPQ